MFYVITFVRSLVRARDDGLRKRPCVKVAELVICIASTILMQCGRCHNVSMFVIPGLDQGPYARDKH